MATTANETPRTAPLAAIQPSMLSVPGQSAASSDQSSRLQSADAGCGGVANSRSSNTDDQATSGQKQTPCLLPADNFGLCSLRSCLCTIVVISVAVLTVCFIALPDSTMT